MPPSHRDFMEAARGWVGTRWVHQGRTKDGIDCAGLLIVAGADVGVVVPDLQGYRRTPNPEKFVGFLMDITDPQTTIEPGYFGIFRDGNQPCHVGVFGERDGRTTLIHAYVGTGKVIEEPYAHDWPRRLFAIRSIRGVV